MPAPRLPKRTCQPTTGGAGDHSAVARPAQRIPGVDAVRGIALLGMFAVHVFGAFDPDGSPSVAWMVAGGRSAATFALVAGFGLAFTTGGRHPAPKRFAVAAVTTRALLIGLIGLMLGHVSRAAHMDVDVVLAFYALLFLLALPLLTLKPRALACTALGTALVAPVLLHVVHGVAPEPDFEGDPTLGDVLTDPLGVASDLLVHGDYPALAWTAYICAGLAMGRLGLTSARAAIRLLCGGLALAIAVWCVSSVVLLRTGVLERLWHAEFPDTEAHQVRDVVLWDVPGGETWWSLMSRAPHSTTPSDMLHTLGAATALLAALLLLTRIAAVRCALSPLAAAGSMPLTLYCAHVLFLATGLLGGAPGARYGVLVAGALLFAVVWRRTRGRGPLEAVVAAAVRQVRRTAGKRATEEREAPVRAAEHTE